MKKRLYRLLLTAAILAIVAVAAVLTLNMWVRTAAKPFLLSREEAGQLQQADCVLILGCGVREDGTPSLMLQDRLAMGLSLYIDGAAPKLLMSGDHGRTDYDEVNAMKDAAMRGGVPSEDVFMDHAGFSTYESMYRARDVFCARRIIIVSQKYHLYRAVYTARRLGLDAWGVPAEDIAYIGQTAREAREILARAKDFIYCLVQPKPTFLGDAIPISGDGNLSNG